MRIQIKDQIEVVEVVRCSLQECAARVRQDGLWVELQFVVRDVRTKELVGRSA